MLGCLATFSEQKNPDFSKKSGFLFSAIFMYLNRTCRRGASPCAPASISTPIFLTLEINSTKNPEINL
jgi:hypothetical protein